MCLVSQPEPTLHEHRVPPRRTTKPHRRETPGDRTDRDGAGRRHTNRVDFEGAAACVNQRWLRQARRAARGGRHGIAMPVKREALPQSAHRSLTSSVGDGAPARLRQRTSTVDGPLHDLFTEVEDGLVKVVALALCRSADYAA
jgi:hypothetical protein